jgi:hypothetical protein
MPVRVTVGPAAGPATEPTPKPPAPKRSRRTTPPAPPRRDAVAANDTDTNESEDTE